MRTTLKITGGTGLTSCLSVRLDQAVKHLREHGTLPDSLDSSAQFAAFRGNDGADVSTRILDPINRASDFTGTTQFDHGWQYGWYDDIDLPTLSMIGQGVCFPADGIHADAMIRAKDIRGRCAVLYRGNDKAKEIGRIDYGMMIEMARDTGYDRFHVQTDEAQFLEAFRRAFPDTTAWDDLPRIRLNTDRYVMPSDADERLPFARRYLAATLALAWSNALIMNTGNTGLWAMIYRGHTRNTWQAHGHYNEWRRLT